MYQRSSDIFLGVPFNTASYWALGKIFAQELGLKPHAFYHTFGDFHIYTGLKKRTQWYRENIGELRTRMKKAINLENKTGNRQGYFDALEWINKESPKDVDYPDDPEEEKYDHVTALIEQFTREIRPSPTLTINNKHPDGSHKRYDELTIDDFIVENYNPHPAIRRSMAV
jgi:thymidylate synthase